jgi:outer membrane protein OmpA-like peptidoglycan-associated protein
MKTYLLGSVAVLALASCSNTIEVFRSYSEAGSVIDGGNFGNSTMNNSQIMTGEKSFAIDLSNRFAKEVPNTINFAFNSAVLDAQARAILDKQAHFIRQFPEVRFRVYGHTDAVGSQAYNRQLGQRRANAAVRYLTSRGISRSRLEAVVSFGETRPVVVSEGRERKNRRTVTAVSGFVKDNPLIMDGKYAEVVYREYLTSAQPKTTVTNTDTGGGE